MWAPADGAPTNGLRGVLRHIATGIETPFRNAEDLMRLLRRDVRCPLEGKDPEK